MANRISAFSKLIRIVQKRIDEKQVAVLQLKNRIEKHNVTLSNMREELKHEQNESCKLHEYASYFTNYQENFYHKQDAIENEISQLEQTLDRQLISIREDFIEQKRYEYLIKNWHSVKKLEEEKLECIENDEASRIIVHERQKSISKAEFKSIAKAL